VVTRQPEKKDLLQFNVAQFLKPLTEASRTYIIENATLPELDQDLVLLAPLSGQVKLTKAGGDILVTGSLNTILQLACSRCLTPIEVPVTIEIEETFNPTVDIISGAKIIHANEVDPATLINKLHILDLDEVVRQSLYLNQPTQILCKKDCLGLCPQCGQNRNLGLCHCQDDHIDARWTGLLAFKNGLEIKD
jgi:uncharacterized protein